MSNGMTSRAAVLTTALAVAFAFLIVSDVHASAFTFSNMTRMETRPAFVFDGGISPFHWITDSPGLLTNSPSEILVSSVTGTVIDVDVTLHDIQYTQLYDLDVWLMGPTGDALMLFSDVNGNPGCLLPFSCNPALTVTITDANIDFEPTCCAGFHDPDWLFTETGTTLSMFNGLNPNGVWSLYAFDDATDWGGLIDGWSLKIETAVVPEPSTMLLLASGLGLFGLEGLRKRRRRKA